MEKVVDKDALVNIMQVKHRQLDRYLFYFIKDRDGIFVPSDRPKFGRKEMLQPGFVDEWSLKDVLADLIQWEKRFINSYEADLRGEMLKVIMIPGDELKPMGMEVSLQPGGQRLEEILTEFGESFLRVLNIVKLISDEALFKPGYHTWTGQATLADVIAYCTYRRYDWVKKRIRQWRQAHPGEYLNKKIILERIQVERRRLEKTLDRLTGSQMLERGVVGDWSVKDILAHLVDWEGRFIGWYEAGLEGDVPETPAPGLTWGELDILNQLIYERHRDRVLPEVITEFTRSYQQVLRVINNMVEEDMFEVGRFEWLGEGNLAGFILANTANHYRWAKTHIQEWMKTGMNSNQSDKKG